jgi:hypothetical protein
LTVGVGAALLAAAAAEVVDVLVLEAVTALVAAVVDALPADDVALLGAAVLAVVAALAVAVPADDAVVDGAVAEAAEAVVGAAVDGDDVATVAVAPHAERPTAASSWALTVRIVRRDTYRWDDREGRMLTLLIAAKRMPCSLQIDIDAKEATNGGRQKDCRQPRHA